MLRMIPVIFIFFAIFSTCGFADNPYRFCLEQYNTTCSKTAQRPLTLESEVGYFFFSNSKMRRIFNQGGFDIRVSGSYPVWKWLQIYGSVEYLERHGRSLNAQQKTKIWEVPLSLGLKCVIPVCRELQYYLTLGPRYFFVHAHNYSSFVDRNISQNGLGGFANIGFNFFPCSNLFMNIFGEYSYGRLHFYSHQTNSYGERAQIGGFAFGGGLGYAF